jgi:uncharacterized Zn finger protein
VFDRALAYFREGRVSNAQIHDLTLLGNIQGSETDVSIFYTALPFFDQKDYTVLLQLQLVEVIRRLINWISLA